MMQILNSKFYRPRNCIQFSGSWDNIDISIKDLKDKYLNTNSPFETLLDDLLSSINLYGDKMVIKKSHLKDFEKCTDFFTMQYSTEYNLIYQNEHCYFHPQLHLFLLANEDLSSEYGRSLYDEQLLTINAVYYDSTDETSGNHLKELFEKYLQKYLPKEATVSILLKGNDGFYFKTNKIHPYGIDLDTMYNEDFSLMHQHIKDKLTNENKGLVLLHGVAGSGKTNYIKWLTSQIPSKNFIFISTNMIASLTNPEFMALLMENKNSILVLEDCENYISERSTDNGNTDVVSSILNIADGMLSDILECQFICTFNSDISQIDHALLRHGRLIAEYKFHELSVERCQDYLQSVGVEYPVKRPMTLAELTNLQSPLMKEKVIEKKIGFL